MITGVTGVLRAVDADRVRVAVGPLELELLVPAADAPALDGRQGEEITFHTSLYIEGEAGGGASMSPRLIGFLREADRGFFQAFITVKGIGPRKALKALALPAGEVAHAIEMKDTRVLARLPGIAKRGAEQIVAELSGKVGRFVPSGVEVGDGTIAPQRPASKLSDAERDAVEALVLMGDRRPDAETLLDRAKSLPGAATTADALIRAMLKLRGTRG